MLDIRVSVLFGGVQSGIVLLLIYRSGFGFGVWSYGFGVSSFGSQVGVFEFRISGFGFRVSVFKLPGSGFGFWVWDSDRHHPPP